MLSRKILWTLLIAALITNSAVVTHAQSAGRKHWGGGASVNIRDTSVPDQAAGQVQAGEAQTASKELGASKGGGSSETPVPPKKAIVGSWLGTSGEGNRLLVSFNSDGVVASSVQGEVSLSLGDVLTTGRGVWRHVGDRQFEFTVVGVFYNIATGEYNGYLKARGSVTLDETGDQMSGTDKVEIFDPDGNLVFAVPPGPLQFRRIKAEPFD